MTASPAYQQYHRVAVRRSSWHDEPHESTIPRRQRGCRRTACREGPTVIAGGVMTPAKTRLPRIRFPDLPSTGYWHQINRTRVLNDHLIGHGEVTIRQRNAGVPTTRSSQRPRPQSRWVSDRLRHPCRPVRQDCRCSDRFRYRKDRRSEFHSDRHHYLRLDFQSVRCHPTSCHPRWH